MYVLLVVPLFTSGCFTAMDQIGDGPGHIRAKTVALDVVTLPVQAVVVAPAYGVTTAVIKHKEKQAAEERNQLMSMLENNPRRSLDERWDTMDKPNAGNQHLAVFASSFDNPNVKYSDNLLEEIYDTCPRVRGHIFQCQTCSKEYLIKHFDERYQHPQNPDWRWELAVIISNQKMPLEVIENIAATNGFVGQADMSARQALQKRSTIEWMPLLESDSGIAQRERWDVKNKWRKIVFINSFTNSTVRYTDELLEDIYQTCPSVRDHVFRSHFCSEQLLRRHFDEEFDRDNSHASFPNGLKNIITNPNTPIDLVEKAATANGHPDINWVAQQTLAKRRSEKTAHPAIQ